ncbi:hypothetical protein [Sphingomonas arantia]|uniref:hypothetical protein n=1 Tax=Sphingomonas arantia TaxID=1460676 RepID=UPI0036D37424
MALGVDELSHPAARQEIALSGTMRHRPVGLRNVGRHGCCGVSRQALRTTGIDAT